MSHENGLITEEIAESIGVNGFMTTISTACSSGANAIAYGAELIKASILDRVIVGGADAISLFNMKGFSSLNIYDPEPCRPFSSNRIELNIGEGAAFLILENEKSREITGNQSCGRLIGWNNSSDAHHQTASSEEGYGAYLSMSKTLEMANVTPSQIDYINMHGTGTPNNDLAESNAVLKLFGSTLPPFSSTKPYTGHTLAAAGAMEAVFCLLALQNQCLFPNLNYVDSNELLKPVVEFTPNYHLNKVLSNSFGFGGNCSSVLISKV